MPSAGSTLASTRSDGILTTKIIRPVRVKTLTRMLNARPKKAFVSPRVHHGTRKVAESPAAGGFVRSMVMTVPWRSSRRGGGLGELGQQGRGVRDPSED